MKQTLSKIKWLGSMLLLLTTLTFVQCGGDDESPEAFTLNGDKFNMKGAKIYLVYEGSYNGYTYRDYIITDGTPTTTDSWSVDDYTDATFLVAIELGTQSEELAAGTFQTKYNWNPVSVDNIAYLYSEVAADPDALEYDTPSDDPAPSVKVKGGFSDGDNISISFSGNLWDEQEEVLVPTKVNFSGTIDDIQ